MIRWFIANLVGFVLVSGLLVTSGEASPLPQITEPASVASVIRIPTDKPYPAPGESLTVPVQAGTRIKFEDESLADAEMTVQDDSLSLKVPGGGTVVLQGLFDTYDAPVRLFFGDTEQNMASLEVMIIQNLLLGDWDPTVELEATAAGPSGGGGEVFGIVQVVTWFMDRMDMMPSAQAAQTSSDKASELAKPTATAVTGVDSPLLRQLLAQMEIAREIEIYQYAVDYLSVADQIVSAISMRAEAGVGSQVEFMQARAFQLQAQLELKEADFNHNLAIDRHQDQFGERLVQSVLPGWEYTPGEKLAESMNRVSTALKNPARRYWRQQRFATETLELLKSLLTTVSEIVEGITSQFQIGKRTLGEVNAIEQLRFQVQVRLAQRRYTLKSAEAWLLAAEGKLTPGFLLHPGWQ